MNAIVNDYQHCVLVNLGLSPTGRGPYVIRQDGYPPESMTFELDRFYLRRDGTWLINLAMFALPEQEKAQFIYDSVEEAVALLEALVGPPSVEYRLPADKTLEELRAAAESTFTGLWGRIRERRESVDAIEDA